MTDHAELIERLKHVDENPDLIYQDEDCHNIASEAAETLTTLRRENADLRAEVERLREVKVLPLVWGDDDWADTPFCSYGIRCDWVGDVCGPFWWQRSEYPVHVETDDRFDTIEAAKAAAQADYASRIRATLGHTQGG